MHWTIVEHPVHISCYPHACAWVNQSIPCSASFLKQPFAVFTVGIGIRFEFGEASLTLELQGHWSEKIGILQNRWFGHINDSFPLIIPWQLRHQRPVRTDKPFNKRHIVQEIKELFLDFGGILFQLKFFQWCLTFVKSDVTHSLFSLTLFNNCSMNLVSTVLISSSLFLSVH